MLLTALAALFILLTPPPASALDPDRAIHQYRRDNWGAEDGLPQSSVYTIAQTTDGYIWLGTMAGLARFDGVEFTLFNSDNTPAFAGNLIINLLADPDGSLWITERRTGVVHYQDGRFTRIPRYSEEHTGSVEAIARSHDGRLWVGATDGFFVLDNHQLSPIELPDEATSAISALSVDNEGAVWIGGSQGGLFKLELDADGAPASSLEPLGKRITVMMVDRAGVTWIGTAGNGLVRQQDGQRSFITTEEGLPSNYIGSLAEDRDGNLWIGTVSGGLVRLRGDECSVMDRDDGLSSNVIYAMLEDREGSLWVGTNDGGVDLLSDSKIIPFTTADGLSDESVFGVYQDSRGLIWVGSQGSGVNTFEGGRFEHIDTGDGLSHEAVLTIAEGPDGAIWLGTYGGGVNRIDGDHIRVFGAEQGLDDLYVLVLTFDGQGRLWAGTDTGLFVLEEGIFRHVLEIPATVSAVLQDTRGWTWVGTSGSGVRLLREGQVETISVDQGLTNNIVSSLYEDRQGRVWIATIEGGLNRWSEGELRALTREGGLPDNSVYCVTGDPDGNLWMSSNRGIIGLSGHQADAYFRGEVDLVETQLLGIADNMKSLEGNGGTQPCAWTTTDQQIWFPTTRGIAAVPPREDTVELPPPPVVIEHIYADGEAIDNGDSTAILFGSQRLEFKYSALSYVSVERIRFRYKLLGFDGEWNEAGAQRAAHYTNLDPGDYIFKVIACNKDGVWNEEGASVRITIQPRFYQTVSFVLICVGSLVLIGLLFERVRQRRQRQREERLKREIDAALAQVKILSGMLPICANCKKIRDDEGYWEHVETYIVERSEAEFSHGICPACAKTLYGEFADDDD